VADSYCSECRFFHKASYTDMGTCKRYPLMQNKHKSDWCGEFAVADEVTLATSVALSTTEWSGQVVPNQELAHEALNTKKNKLSRRQMA
jgi:hypothetical protein